MVAKLSSILLKTFQGIVTIHKKVHSTAKKKVDKECHKLVTVHQRLARPVNNQMFQQLFCMKQSCLSSLVRLSIGNGSESGADSMVNTWFVCDFLKKYSVIVVS